MPPVIALAILTAMMVALVVARRVAAADRRAALKAWAAAHAFSYDAGPVRADELGFDLPSLAAARRPRATNVMEGTWRGRRALVLDVRGRTGGRSSGDDTRLVVVTEGALPAGANTELAKDLLGSIASAVGGLAFGATVRTRVTIRVNGTVRSDFDTDRLTPLLRLAGMTGAKVESGASVTALVAPCLLPAAKVEALLDLAATLLEAPAAAPPQPADPSSQQPADPSPPSVPAKR
jgi:hypothetical protein